MSELANQLMATPLGRELNRSDAASLVEQASARTIQTGETLFGAGSGSDFLYIILAGHLEVVLGVGETPGPVVAHLTAGQVVGELELMTGSTRVATVRATQETEVLALAKNDFFKLIEHNNAGAVKLLVNIAKTLARRLAMVNQRVLKRFDTPSAVPQQTAAAAHTHSAPAIEHSDLSVLDSLWGA